jgi:mannose-1-phosphate guanylyltransferase/mannose-6-phosphate isomerase
MIPIRPVILSGGSGTRLWPVSRKHFPKQFAPLLEDESLFSKTLRRVEDRTRFLPPILIGNIEHRFLMMDTFERLDIKDTKAYLEPIGRNTAVAAIIAALVEEKAVITTGKRSYHLVMPSDHVITDKCAFESAIIEAQMAVEEGKIVLFGIKPSHADTGFGYILQDGKTSHKGVQGIAKFVEKPSENVAKDLIKEGAIWNSGIFFYDPTVLLAEVELLMPEDLALCREALAKSQNDMSGVKLDQDSYNRMGNQPFDKAIMEKTDKGAVVACDIGWSDLGSWEALWQIEKKDDQQNSLIGSVVIRDVEGSYIHSYGPAIAVMGVSDLVVVATKDSVLIAPRARSQDVRELIGDIEGMDGALALEHPRVMRPWGSYESIAAGGRFQVKHIVVLPGRSLSLQMHHHRAEHWVVVVGTANVECGDSKKMVFPNESVYIPSGVKHRLTNPGKVDLHLIEVQSGDYLGEDDIIRFEDTFGRVAKEAS